VHFITYQLAKSVSTLNAVYISEILSFITTYISDIHERPSTVPNYEGKQILVYEFQNQRLMTVRFW